VIFINITYRAIKVTVTDFSKLSVYNYNFCCCIVMIVQSYLVLMM